MDQKARKEMDPRFMWDVTHIFKTRDDWEKAYRETEAEIRAVGALEGTLSKGPDQLLQALERMEAIAERVMRIYTYAGLHKAGDNGDPDFQQLEARAITLYVAFDTATSFVNPELIAIDEATLEAYMADERLTPFRHFVANITRVRAHTLDTAGERMLAKLGDAAKAPDDIFTMLESVDMGFPPMIDAEGKEVPLTHGNFPVFRESADRRVRKEAFEKYFGEFKRYVNTFAASYAGSVKFDCFFADVRGYESACTAALSNSNVPVSVYDSLISAVRGGLPIMKQYLGLRKRILKLDELNMYDLYNPMIPSVEYKLDFEGAKQLVKDALKPLGAEYQGFLDEAYAHGWIDVYENKGKTTGAFCTGCYGAHPYVLLNYTNTLDDAFTLAHELGHAMHSHLSAREQRYINSNYLILVAEVASMVNEVLMLKHLLRIETDPHRRAYILNHFLEGFRTGVFRQTLFAEFERRTHDMYGAGEPLTAQSLSAVYRELNGIYYEGATVNDLMDIEWARIPHFYDAFYVYQYATGFSSAVVIANDILKTGDPSRFFKFLSMGGSDYPLEELKVAGVDLTRPDAVASALGAFQATLDEFESVLKQIEA